ncbi:hypothetical protein AURDEDRAFT_128765 [Auricularia subglabra TFB-10046 SS5]|nr:hypothetical protein AURDEDRAFT_128765 [Auricularia subglabra TFB-10046 SS5]
MLHEMMFEREPLYGGGGRYNHDVILEIVSLDEAAVYHKSWLKRLSRRMLRFSGQPDILPISLVQVTVIMMDIDLWPRSQLSSTLDAPLLRALCFVIPFEYLQPEDGGDDKRPLLPQSRNATRLHCPKLRLLAFRSGIARNHEELDFDEGEAEISLDVPAWDRFVTRALILDAGQTLDVQLLDSVEQLEDADPQPEWMGKVSRIVGSWNFEIWVQDCKPYICLGVDSDGDDCICMEFKGTEREGKQCKSTACGHKFELHTLHPSKGKKSSETSEDSSDTDALDDEPPTVDNIIGRHSIKLKVKPLDKRLLKAGQHETSQGLRSGQKTSGLGLIDTLGAAFDQTQNDMREKRKRNTKNKESSDKIATVILLPNGIDEDKVLLPSGNLEAELRTHGLIVSSKSLPKTLDIEGVNIWLKEIFVEPMEYLEGVADEKDDHTPGESLVRAVQCKAGANAKCEIIRAFDLLDGETLHRYISNKKQPERCKLVLGMQPPFLQGQYSYTIPVSKYPIAESEWTQWRAPSAKFGESRTEAKSLSTAKAKLLSTPKAKSLLTLKAKPLLTPKAKSPSTLKAKSPSLPKVSNSADDIIVLSDDNNNDNTIPVAMLSQGVKRSRVVDSASEDENGIPAPPDVGGFSSP